MREHINLMSSTFIIWLSSFWKIQMFAKFWYIYLKVNNLSKTGHIEETRRKETLIKLFLLVVSTIYNNLNLTRKQNSRILYIALTPCKPRFYNSILWDSYACFRFYICNIMQVVRKIWWSNLFLMSISVSSILKSYNFLNITFLHQNMSFMWISDLIIFIYINFMIITINVWITVNFLG